MFSKLTVTPGLLPSATAAMGVDPAATRTTKMLLVGGYASGCHLSGMMELTAQDDHEEDEDRCWSAVPVDRDTPPAMKRPTLTPCDGALWLFGADFATGGFERPLWRYHEGVDVVQPCVYSCRSVSCRSVVQPPDRDHAAVPAVRPRGRGLRGPPHAVRVRGTLCGRPRRDRRVGL